MSRRGPHEGSIYQRPDGLWVAAVHLGYRGGKRERRYLYGKTRREAAEKLAKLIQGRDEETLQREGRETLAAFLERWLAHVKPTVRPSTYTSYAGHVNEHLLEAIGGIRVGALETRDVQALLAAETKAGLSPRTVAMTRDVLRIALNQAMRWGELDRNVAALAQPPRQVKTPVVPLTPDEAKAVLAAVEGDRLAALYTLMLATGLRRGEALGLCWQDVDLAAGMLTVSNALQRIPDEGLVLVEPKSRTSRRTVALPAFVVDALQLHREGQDAEKAKAAKKKRPWNETWGLIFTSEKRRGPIDPDYVGRHFTQLLADANLRTVRLHDLRHSCASLLLAAGLSPRQIMDVLGHSQIGHTLGIYAHLFPGAEAAPAAAMEAMFGTRGCTGDDSEETESAA